MSDYGMEVVGKPDECLASVAIDQDTDSEEYGSYCITITTSLRTITIKGCHDIGPEFEVTPAPCSESPSPP